MRSGSLRIAAIAALIGASLWSYSANAPASAASTFVGSTIEAAAGFPDGPFGTAGNTIEAGPIQFVVGPGMEIIGAPIGPLFPFNGPSFDFAAATITITSVEVQHAPATFNGYSFFDVFATIDPIFGVAIQSDNTGFFSGDPSRVFFDANTIHVNFQGLSMSPETNVVLSVTFADGQIPVPAALPLFAAGLGVMGLLGWRRKRSAVAMRHAR